MKRLIYILLVLSLIASLVSCAAAAPNDNMEPSGDGYFNGGPESADAFIDSFDFEWNEKYQGYFVYERDNNPYIDVVIPSQYRGMPVVGIGKYAFNSYSKIRTVVIPESITVIESFAFNYCDYLKYVEFEYGSTLRSINDYAFSNCKILSRIDVPASVEKIGYRAFSTCPMLSKVNVDAMNEHYCHINGTLYSKDETILISVAPALTDTIVGEPGGDPTDGGASFIVSDGVISIADGAFRDCDNIERIYLPSTIQSLGANIIGAFLKEINFAGTIDEWEAIEKNEKWDEKAQDYVVNCTNGTIEKGE